MVEPVEQRLFERDGVEQVRAVEATQVGAKDAPRGQQDHEAQHAKGEPEAGRVAQSAADFPGCDLGLAQEIRGVPGQDVVKIVSGGEPLAAFRIAEAVGNGPIRISTYSLA